MPGGENITESFAPAGLVLPGRGQGAAADNCGTSRTLPSGSAAASLNPVGHSAEGGGSANAAPASVGVVMPGALALRARRIDALTRWLQDLLGPEAALLWQAVQARSGIETHLFRATLPWRCRHAIHEIDGAENGPHPEGVELWRAQVKDSHFHERALAQATLELVVAA